MERWGHKLSMFYCGFKGVQTLHSIFPRRLRMARGATKWRQKLRFCTLYHCSRVCTEGRPHGWGGPGKEGNALGGGSKKHSHILLSSYQGKWGGEKESMKKQRRPKIYLAHPTCF